MTRTRKLLIGLALVLLAISAYGYRSGNMWLKCESSYIPGERYDGMVLFCQGTLWHYFIKKDLGL